MSGLQGYSSPRNPVITQSPGAALNGPSKVWIINSLSVLYASITIGFFLNFCFFKLFTTNHTKRGVFIMIYNIFISHAWKYSSDYYKIVQWLNEAQTEGKLTWKNYSVPEHDPLVDPNSAIGKIKLQQLIKQQIQPSSVVLILGGMYSAYSDWIDYELNTAYGFKKYIIGVEPWGQERVPQKIQLLSDTMSGWNKNSVINSILNSR